jgi:hypothetical protein
VKREVDQLQEESTCVVKKEGDGGTGTPLGTFLYIGPLMCQHSDKSPGAAEQGGH